MDKERDLSLIELRTLIVSAIGLSVGTFDISFQLGAHNTIYFDRLLTLWVAATVVLLISLLTPKEIRPIGRNGIFALLAPTFWYVINSFLPRATDVSGYDVVVWVVTLILFSITIPYILYVLFALIETDAVSMSAQDRNKLIAVVLVIGIIGYFVGTYHPYFVSCEQFEIAGYFVPDNCVSWFENR